MKLGTFSNTLPVYRIESDVTYHTERKPTVFERMILRLCEQGRYIPSMAELSLQAVFQKHLGAGDTRDLLTSTVEELTVLGAIPRHTSPLDIALSKLGLTDTGREFLRNDRLPVRNRTVKVWHHYDPVIDEIKSAKAQDRLPQQGNNRASSSIDQLLRPQSPLALVERTIEEKEEYDWKNPSTVIDEIQSVVTDTTGWKERTIEISCNKDGVLSVAAPKDPALQQWLGKIEPESIWDVLLADILEVDPQHPLGSMSATILQEANSVYPANQLGSNPTAASLYIIPAEHEKTAGAATPTIVLNPEVDKPQLVDDADNPSKYLLNMPISPNFLGDGFQKAFLSQFDSSTLHVEFEGRLRLYWHGQPRDCGLTIILGDERASKIWISLREAFEEHCRLSDDPRIAFLPMVWKETESFPEVITPWLSQRSARPLEVFLSVVETLPSAFNLWLEKPLWRAALETALIKTLPQALVHTPKELDLVVASSFIKRLEVFLPEEKAKPFQEMLLLHVKAIRSPEELAQLRKAVAVDINIPEKLITSELRQIWLTEIVERKSCNLHGPHTFIQPLQTLQDAVATVYREIGKQALAAAMFGQVDARNLTPRALKSVAVWQSAKESYLAINTTSPEYEALGIQVERWHRLAQEKLAPVQQENRFVVLDSSALMEHSDLLQQIPVGDVAVIPFRVLSELDGLKSSGDQERSAKARAAIRQIEFHKENIRYEKDYVDLLPQEWDEERVVDNMILSSALYLRLNEVLFVSNDINQRNKAEALGLTAQSAKAYMQLGNLASSTGIEGKKKGNNR